MFPIPGTDSSLHPVPSRSQPREGNIGAAAPRNYIQTEGSHNHQNNAERIKYTHNYYTPARDETPPSPSSTVQLRRDPEYVQREALTLEIHDTLAKHGGVVALSGLGGIGKTQLATDYALQVRGKSSKTWVLWIHASTPTRFEESVRHIANRIKIQGREDPGANIYELLQNWLCDSNKGSWLIVLDNADDARFLLSPPAGAAERSSQPLKDYLQVCEHGSMIITTRSMGVARELVNRRQIIEVPPMSEDVSKTFLFRRLGDGEQEMHLQLAKALGFIPLAMAQAAAYITQRRKRKERNPVGQYLGKIEKSRRSRTNVLLLNAKLNDRDREASNSVMVTWQISFEQIQEERKSAADLLSLMSFCDRQAIPKCLVQGRLVWTGDMTEGSNEGDAAEGGSADEDDSANEGDSIDQVGSNEEDDEFEEDIETLLDFSFISVVDDANWEMHQLVQDATQLWLKNQGTLQDFRKSLIERLLVAWPPPADDEFWPTCHILFPQAKRCSEVKPVDHLEILVWSMVMLNAASYASLQGYTSDSVNLAAKSREAKIHILGENHELTRVSTSLLAYNLKGMRLLKESMDLQQQLVEAINDSRGPDHRDTLIARRGLAVKHYNLGQHDKAEELLIPLLETMKDTLGPNDPDVIKATSDLVVVYASQNRLQDAVGLQEQVFEKAKAIRGHVDIQTEAFACELAVMYYMQGWWDKAQELLLRALGKMRENSGTENVVRLKIAEAPAMIYWGQERRKDAEKLLSQVVEERRALHGHDHPEMFMSMIRLACTHIEQNRRTEAEELLKWITEQWKSRETHTP